MSAWRHRRRAAESSARAIASDAPRGGAAEQSLRSQHQHADQQRQRDGVLEFAAILECGVAGDDADQQRRR